MPTSISFHLLLLLLLTCAPHPLSSIPTTHNRRTLHQPFFPQDSIPPSQPPNSTPKLPFSTTPTTTTPPPSSDQQPFFPSFPSPPPPPLPPSPPSPFASFPANISSLSLPTPPKSKPVSSKLIATAIAAVLAASVILFAVVFLHLRKKKRHSISTTTTDQKSHPRSSDNNSSSGVHKPPPPLRRASQTSSEFLYLGTLVNSHNAGNIDSQPQGSSNLGRDISNISNVINPRKLDSPELRPLPPLSGQIFQHNHENAEVGSSREEFSEEFYSPRVSLGGRESSIGAGSASRRAFAEVAVENFETRRMMGSGSGSGSSSFSDSSSGSGNRARSVSLSISPPVSLSPISSRPKSPELIAIQTAAAPPSRPPPPPPMPPRLTTFAPSPPNTSSPERDLSSGSSSPAGDSRRSHESSPGLSIFYPRKFSNSVSIPAPPPPPPPPRLPPVAVQLESPTTPAPVIGPAMVKPPALVAPSRPVAVQSGTPLVSPMELPEVNEGIERNEDTPKPKLKPLHWDKVRASSDREMVWDQLKSSSFKLDEEMIETLFIVKTPNSNASEINSRRPMLPSPSQENRVLDPKKSQNIAISLRALNVTVEEVCEALLEGNADALGTELLESLLKMAPTKEEERKLIEYNDNSPFKLGPAEKFLKALLDVPFAFKRVDAMLYISNFDSEVDYLKRGFGTLEAACEELRSNRMFLKLLEAVLKTGNRMNVGTNRGEAHAFKLDTLLKLVDVKGADGKTTLLHFVVQEIIRSEGARLSTAKETSTSTINDDAKCRKLGLQVVSGLISDLANVKKAAGMDSEVLNGDVMKLSKGISNILEVVRLNEGMGSEENRRRFSESMSRFMKLAEEEIIRIQAQESVALSLVKEITEYFHGNSAKEEAHPFRIFMVVRDFLTVLDRVCKEVGTINERTIVSSAHKFPIPVNPTLPPVFSAFPGKRQYSSSDDEGSLA